MNITYIVNVFPKISETFVLDQITYLIDRGHNVNIIASSDWRESEMHEDVEKYNLRAKTVYLAPSDCSPDFGITGGLIQSILFADVIHAHFANWPAETAMQIAKLTGIPFVFTAHAFDIFVDPDVGRLIRMVESCSKLLTVTEFNKNYLLGMIGEGYREKIEIIRCAVDTNKLQPSENKPKDKIVILLCGRFVEKKGITYALKAFARLPENANAELRIIGDGPLADEIQAEIEKLGISQKVKLLGPQSRSVVFNELRNAHIFLLPSVTAQDGDREGLPVSILEAQALAVPVISTLHTGIPEGVIDRETGFLTQERDVEEIAQKLKLLVVDADLRKQMGKKGRDLMISKFNTEIEFPKLESVLSQLVTDKSLLLKMHDDETQYLLSRLKALHSALDKQHNEIVLNKDKIIAEQADQIRLQDRQLLEKNKKIMDRDDRITKLHQSLSWRITAPLRRISRLIKRI